MPKAPTAKEFLSDPKYGEQKGFLKEILSGIADEIRTERKNPKRKSSDDEGNIFDIIFGPKENEDDE